MDTNKSSEKNEIDEYEGVKSIIKIEKKEIPVFEKEKGKKLFSEKKYEEASKAFTKVNSVTKAIYGCQMLTKDEIITPEEYLELYQPTIILPSHLNLALCLMKLNDYSTALKHTNAVLEIDSNNEKGLYRHGICHTMLKNFKEAFNALEKGKKLYPETVEFEVGIKNLQKAKNLSDKKRIEFNKAMMKGLSDPVIKESNYQKILKILKSLKPSNLIDFCSKRKIFHRK